MAQYEGSCHCGRVAYEVEADLGHTLARNCSDRQRRGSIINTQTIQHLFSETCGIEPFAKANGSDGTPRVAVNARFLVGVEPGDLSPTMHAGRSR